jgi:hypothetical protein
MVYLAIVLMGALPYYILFKSPKPRNALIIFSISAIGFLIYTLFPYLPKSSYNIILEAASFATSLLTFYLSYKTTNLTRLSYYFLFLNAVSIFVLPSHIFNVYYLSVLGSAFLLYAISIKYIEIFESANFYNVKGLALKSPKLALMLRLTLMALGLYPPFSNFFSLFLGILKESANTVNYIIFSWIFFANFFMAFRIMKNTIFGAPNENIVYKDISGKTAIAMTFLLLVLALVGFSNLLEALTW